MYIKLKQHPFFFILIWRFSKVFQKEQETAGLKVRAYDQGESRKENGNSGFDTFKINY